MTHLLTGFLTGLGLIVAIGSQNAFVLRQGLLRQHVTLIVVVCALGDIALELAGVLGMGAVVGALNIHELRKRMSGEAAIRACTISLAFAMAALALSNEPVLTAAALVLAACGSDQKPASPAPGSSDSTAPDTLTFWGTYGNGGVVAQPNLWGLPTVVTTAVPAKTLAIGAFTGASSGAAASDSAVPGAGSTGPGSASHIARHAHHTH